MGRLNAFFSGFKEGFTSFSHIITNTVAFILLAFAYIVGVGLVAVISKMAGKHFLDLKSKGSSWIKRDAKKPTIEDFYRSF